VFFLFRFPHAKKVVFDPKPKTTEAFVKKLSHDLKERIDNVYYYDPCVSFLVELTSMDDLKDMCRIEVPPTPQ
jgi:hypothetical protein